MFAVPKFIAYGKFRKREPIEIVVMVDTPELLMAFEDELKREGSLVFSATLGTLP
jgi:hypothetical protein